MPGRITSNMLSSNYLRNMKRNLTNMKTLQNQLASGKEIQKASENPYKASRSMQLHAEISYNKQYNENIKDVSNWLDTTDTAMSQLGSIFARVEELLVSAGNASYGQDEKTAIQDEIKEKVNELAQVLNTSFDGSYIFGGTKTSTKPVTVDSSGKLQYANKKGEAIIKYLNAAGDVTNNSISGNNLLTSSDSIYLDSNGKITTSSTSAGNANTKIINSGSLYVDITSPTSTMTGTISTSSSANTNPLLVKDDLYEDLNGNYTSAKTTENTLINSDDELFYLTTDGKVTTTYASTYTLIPTGTVLYKGTNGEVTISGTAQNQINSASPVYKDAKGFVTTSSVTVNEKLPTTAGSVNTLNVSKYTPATGYTQTLISSSCDIYMDSRGVLTNSSTTDLSMRQSTLKDLWSNSYIDSTNQQIINLAPTSSQDKQINLYKDSSGQVTTSPGGYPANEQILLGTNLYKTTDGKVTTIAGTGTTPLQLTDTVYVDLNGNLTSSVTVTNKPVSVRDNLYIPSGETNIKAKIGVVSSPDIEVPSDNINLYEDGSGNITSNGTGTTKIILSNSLYKDSYGNITIDQNTQNTLIDSDDKLYKDANGNVTNSVSYTQVIAGTALYKDSTGRVTTLQGGTPPNESIDLNSTALYKDAKGNVTTLASLSGVANTLIDSKTSLYKDVKGNITTVASNTQITSDIQLYNDNGEVTTEPGGDTLSTLITNGLYRDASGNLTTLATGNTQITSTVELFEDASGNVITSPGNTLSELINNGTPLYTDPSGMITTSSAGNTLITGASLPTQLYTDSSGNVTTSSGGGTNTSITLNTKLSIAAPNLKVAPKVDQSQNAPIPPLTTKLYIDGTQVKTKLITTGDSLYADVNGKIITSTPTTNTQLTASDNIYVDVAGNLTLSATTANKELTMLDVKNYKNELQSSSITTQRKTEINKILSDDDIAQLIQIDSDLEVDISEGVKTDYNKTAVDILEFKDRDGNTINVSDLLGNIIKDLGAGGTTTNLTTTYLKGIQSVTSNLLQHRSEVGSYQNRMDSAKGNNETQNYDMTDILSKTEDIDFAEKTMEYSMMQTVYTAALQTSAKILPMTILTYL